MVKIIKEKKHRIPMLLLKGEKKTNRIVIRCTPNLLEKWKLFLLKNRSRFRTASDALDYLLSLAEAPRISRY
jgi:hypothetical protein